MGKTIYLIRHGQIRSNVEERYSGRSDEALTSTGVEQAEALGLELRQWGISAIYSSPLRRTAETASILNRHFHARLAFDPDLTEMDLGPWTGLAKKDVAMRFPGAYRTWVESPGEFAFEGMETLQAVRERVIRALDSLGREPEEEIAAVVTHAVVVKAAFIHYNGLTLGSYHNISVPNLSVHRLTLGQGVGQVVRVK